METVYWVCFYGNMVAQKPEHKKENCAFLTRSVIKAESAYSVEEHVLHSVSASTHLHRAKVAINAQQACLCCF